MKDISRFFARIRHKDVEFSLGRQEGQDGKRSLGADTRGRRQHGTVGVLGWAADFPAQSKGWSFGFG